MEAETRTIVRSALDASAYKAGADQITSSNQRIAESSDQAAGATQRQREEVRQTGGSIDALQRQLDGAFRGQQRFAQAQQTINAALERGRISQARATELLQLAEARYLGAAAAAGRFNAANDNAGAGTGRWGAALGQAGFQVQDFATQVAMGQNALVAFGTQFAQFAGFFGTAGAIAGAAVTIGVIAAQLLGASTATDGLNEAVKRQNELYQGAIERGERYREGLRREADEILRLRDAYVSYTNQRRGAEEGRLLDQQRTLAEQAEAQRRAAAEAIPDSLRNMADLAAARSQRGQSIGAGVQEADAAIRSALTALYELRAAGTLTTETVARLAEMLQDAGAAAGTGPRSLGAQFMAGAAALRAMIPRMEELDRASAQNQRQLEALRGTADGAGGALGGAASEAGRLATEMQRLARIAAQDPLADIARDAGRVQAQLAALRTGGLAALEAERDAQAITRAGEEARERILQQERERLGRPDSGVSPSDLEARAQAAADAARLAGQEAERDRQRLRDEEAAARERAREANRTPRSGGRSSADRDLRREEEEARRLFDSSRTAAEEYARTLERLGELRPTLERLFGADGANEVIERQAQRALETLDRAENAADKIRLMQDATRDTSDAARDLGLTFGSAFEDAVVNASSFSDILKGIEQDLLRLGTRRLVTEPLVNGLSSLFTMAAGATGFGGPTAEILGALGPAKVMHSGGMVGDESMPARTVSAATFVGARRYHGGGDVLAPDEVPIIAQRGERVLNRQEAAAYRSGGNTFVFQFPNGDAQSFRNSRAQTERAAAGMMQRAQRNT